MFSRHFDARWCHVFCLKIFSSKAEFWFYHLPKLYDTILSKHLNHNLLFVTKSIGILLNSNHLALRSNWYFSILCILVPYTSMIATFHFYDHQIASHNVTMMRITKFRFRAFTYRCVISFPIIRYNIIHGLFIIKQSTTNRTWWIINNTRRIFLVERVRNDIRMFFW